MTTYRFPLAVRQWRDGDTHPWPLVDVRVEEDDVNYQALVDTGAAVSVVRKDVLLECGWTADEIDAGELVRLEAAGGEVLSGRMHELTLKVGGLTLLGVPCVVVDDAPDLVLLGQQRALERLRFEQDGPELQGVLALTQE